MSNRAKQAAIKAYPLPNFSGMIENDASIIAAQSTFKAREYYIEGYDQAEKDIISYIRKTIKLWIPEKDGEEYTDGKRLAFNSVLHLLKEIEEEQ